MVSRSPTRGFTARPRLLVPIIVAIVVVIAAVAAFVSIYTDYLWFDSVHFTGVFTTLLGTKVLLFAMFGVAMSVLVGANIVIAYLLRPPFRPMSAEQQNLERYRMLIEPHAILVLLVVCGLVGLFAGLAAAGDWHTWLLWRHGTPFHATDAQFHRDISYFTFTYPFQRLVLTYAFVGIALSVVAAVLTHYAFGGLRIQTPGEKLVPAARAHLSVLLGLFVALKAVAYWLDRYGLAFSDRGVVTGPSYTDVHAVLPAKTILTVVAAICALLFFANVAYRNWLLPAVGLGLLVLSAIVIGGVYPAVIEHFKVTPNAQTLEAPYIARNIAATRTAYGIDKVKTTPYDAVSTAPGQLRDDAATIPGIRLLDPTLLSPTYDQLQQVRSFYGFPDTLDVDRYPVNGGPPVDTIVAAREIDQTGLSPGQRGWVNEHLVYTHGYGFVAAPGNAVTEGAPDFVEKDIPPTGALGKFQPRIYFGEQSPVYSVVGGPPGSKKMELDFPNESADGQQNNTYQGTGGVSIGSTFRRLLYAAHFADKNLLLSGAINADSKILYVRDPRERVAKVAPFLTLDGDPYPAIVDGRILWIVDGYTTSDGYPYSERESLGDVTADQLTATSNSVAGQQDNTVNYIRNSVKATVDAYNGTVTLYEWHPNGKTDPVLQTWEKVFPGIVKPQSAMSPALLAHVRYPEDLFKVQRGVLATYHVGDPNAFYNGTDFWKVPTDPTDAQAGNAQPPYYLTLSMPGQSSPSFSLTSTLVPLKKANLAAFVSVDSDVGPDYGTIRVLQLPRNTAIPGPGQVENNFESNATISAELSLLRRGGSDVELGNLLTLPVGGGLLYVQPIYVRANNGESYPLLQRVAVGFGTDIGFANTLSDALDQVFSGTVTTTPPPGGGGPPTPTSRATLSPALRQALADAAAAEQAAKTDLAKGDFAAYGADQKNLSDAIARAQAAAGQNSSPSASPSVAGSPASAKSPAATAKPSATPGPSG